MIEFAKVGKPATHMIQRLDLTGHVRGKGHKWKDILPIRITDRHARELTEFILLHKIATERELRRHKIRIVSVENQLGRGARKSCDPMDFPAQL